MRLYHIKYVWPNGRVAYRTDAGLTAYAERADQYTWADAKQILLLARDAFTIWKVVATMEGVMQTRDNHKGWPVSTRSDT